MGTTRCVLPPPLSDDQLSTVLDDLATPEIMAHLEQCPACAARLANMKHFDAVLGSQLHRFDCPTAQQLTDYVMNFLDTETTAQTAKHISTCPRCQKELDLMNSFLESEQPESSVSPKIVRPPRKLWRAVTVKTAGNLALRGLEDQTTRDAQAGSASLYLEARPVTNGVVLTGQIIDEQVDWRQAVIELQQASLTRQVKTLDEFCEFRFELNTSSPVDLYVTALDGIVLVLEQLSLKP